MAPLILGMLEKFKWRMPLKGLLVRFFFLLNHIKLLTCLKIYWAWNVWDKRMNFFGLNRQHRLEIQSMLSLLLQSEVYWEQERFIISLGEQRMKKTIVGGEHFFKKRDIIRQRFLIGI